MRWLRARRASTVLANAAVVSRDAVAERPLALAGGRVAVAAPAGAFRLDLGDHVVYPGLINAHDHLQLNAVPPLPHDAPFPNVYAWIDAFGAHRARPDVVAAVAVAKEVRHWHGALKNLLAGATTVAHHDPRDRVLDTRRFPVHVPRDLGWSHSLGLGDARDGAAPRYGPPVAESHAATPAAHPWVVHLAEGTDDVARAELGRLEALGCLTANAVLVHAVGLTPGDVSRVISRGAAVVWCPASNLELFGSTLDALPLARARRLALGSDSRLTGSRDLLDELHVAASCARLSAAELLRLVTVDAASALRLADRGHLEPGARGDCVIVRADGEPRGALAGLRRSDLRAVVRDGRPVVADPDLAEWFAHCGVATARVRLDGRPKLIARWALHPEAAALEPGLSLDPAA